MASLSLGIKIKVVLGVGDATESLYFLSNC